METKLKSDQTLLPPCYFFLTGVGAMVSWNAMLNSFDYFDDKYPQFHVSFSFPIAIYVAQFLSSLVVTQLSAKLPYLIRLMASFLLVTLIVIFLPFEAKLLEGTSVGFWLIMVLLFIVGFLNNVCFSSAMGLASQLRGKYTTFLFMGSAFIGLVMSILRQIATWIFTDSDSNQIFSVTFFFAMAAFILLVVIFMQPVFVRSSFYRTRFIEDKAGLGEIDRERSLVEESTGKIEERNFRTLYEITKEVWLPILLLVICYVQTYAVFPGVMEEKPTPTITNQVKVVSMTLSFMCSSLIGKIIGRYRRIYSLWSVGAIVVIRFALIVFFVIQAADSDIDVFKTLWFGYLNIILFGLSYGFITVSLCIIGPEQVLGEKKEIVGYISMFALNLGTVIGTLIALPFRDLDAPAST